MRATGLFRSCKAAAQARKRRGLYSLLKNSEMSAQPWKSGPSGPRKIPSIVRALAPVVVFPQAPTLSANCLAPEETRTLRSGFVMR